MAVAARRVVTAAEQMIWKGCYLGMRSLVICNRLRQITSWMTISMPAIATKNLHRTMLPRSEAINAKQIVPIITTGRIAPVIQLSDIEGNSPLSVPFWHAHI